LSQSKISRVYAISLYEAAVDEGRVEAVRRDLGAFVEALKSSAELRHLLVAEEINDAQKTAVLMELTEGGDELVRNFLRIIVDKSRESELTDVYDGFVELDEKAKGIVHVEVVTAVDMTDKEILGGLRLRIGDRIADASVRYRLDTLRELLTSPMASLEGSVETAS
jgi:F-type H+-transporting ATPase subunit delta